MEGANAEGVRRMGEGWANTAVRTAHPTPAIRTLLEYRAPAYFDDTLQIDTRSARLGR